MAAGKVCSSEIKTSFLPCSYVFRWSIEHFPKYLATFKMASHEFQPLNERFERLFSVSLEKQENFCLFTINSFQKGTNVYRIEINYSITVIDSTGKVFQRDTTKRVYEQGLADSFYVEYSNEALIDYSDSAEHKTLIFNCLMEFDELASTAHKDQLIRSPSYILPDLLKDLKVMYADSLHTDLELLVQEDVVRVHKSVLSARSPVFAKLLVSPMEEKSKNKIKIDDIKLPILKAFVEFLYTGSMLESEFESVCGLYYAADKYDVSSLRKACSDILVDQLDVENACGALSLANRHTDEKLKNLVMDFMKFEFEAILASEPFADFVKTETELAIEVLKLRGKKTEKRSSSVESA